MTDRDNQIERIIDAALKHEGSARAAFLAEACAGDAALQRDVESLIAQESAAQGFLPAAPGFDIDDAIGGLEAYRNWLNVGDCAVAVSINAMIDTSLDRTREAAGASSPVAADAGQQTTTVTNAVRRTRC